MITEANFAELAQNLPFSGHVHYTVDTLGRFIADAVSDAHGVEVDSVELLPNYPHFLHFRTVLDGVDLGHVHWAVSGEQESVHQKIVVTMCSDGGVVNGTLTTFEAILFALMEAGLNPHSEEATRYIEAAGLSRCSAEELPSDTRTHSFEVPVGSLVEPGSVVVEGVVGDQEAVAEQVKAVAHAYEMWRGEPLDEELRREMLVGNQAPTSVAGLVQARQWQDAGGLVVGLPVTDEECSEFTGFLGDVVVDGFVFTVVENPARSLDAEGKVAGNIFRLEVHTA